MPSVSASSTSSGNGAASGVVSDLTREQADLRTIAVHDDHLVLRGNIRNLLRSTPYISALCIRADPFSALQKGVAHNRTTQAMRAAAPAAQFSAGNFDDFNAGSAHFPVCLAIAVICNDDAPIEREHIIAIVPLFGFSFISIAACAQNA